MHGLVGALFGLGFYLFTSLSWAQPSESEPPEPENPHTVSPAPQPRTEPWPAGRRWYGWQALAVDGGAATLWLTSITMLLVDDSYDDGSREHRVQALSVVGAVGYLAAAPTFHLLHRQPWHALGSLGMRAGLPILGGAIGLTTQSCPPRHGEYGNCGAAGLLVGAAAGAVVAMVLDDGLLAWQPRANAERAQTRLGISPVLSADGRRELRVFGTF